MGVRQADFSFLWRAAFVVLPSVFSAISANGGTEQDYQRSVGIDEDIARDFATFSRPFHQQSLWNSRPIDPVLGNRGIPADNVPYINDREFGTKIYAAATTDPAEVVYGRFPRDGVFVSDELRYRKVRIPHFPANVVPAKGSDGHCEIYDRSTGLIHGFYGLSVQHNRWEAMKYTVAFMGGTGWGTPERPDGPRASGVSTAGGLMRSAELGLDIIPHALSIGLATNGFRTGPSFPATMQDVGGESTYTGAIPMGALLMLPLNFDDASLSSAGGRTIARTLKLYGARLIDRTHATFAIYGEIGGGWSEAVSSDDLAKIRNELRAVDSVKSWIDGTGNNFIPTAWEKMNLLSMRGPWTAISGRSLVGQFDITRGAYIVGPTAKTSVIWTVRYLREASPVSWQGWLTRNMWQTNPSPNESYKLSAFGLGNLHGQLVVRTADNKETLFSSASLGPGQFQVFRGPSQGFPVTLILLKVPPGGDRTFRLELQRIQ